LLGVHPETGNNVKANLGRFGPYVVHTKGKDDGKDDYRSIKADDDVLTIELARALEMLAQQKAGRGRKAVTPIYEIGKHPADEEPINVYDGPYGPYIKHGKVNVSVPEGKKPEEVAVEEAVALLAEKGGVVKKKTAKKSTAEKSTAKKSTAKKSTAKKSTAKKSTASKTAAKETVTEETTASKTAAKKTTKKASTTQKTAKATSAKSADSKAKATRTAAAKKTTKTSATEKIAPE
jgi:DNA topoisomerase I